MKTTIDHLLTPRFEVIADYPGTMRNIGSIIDSDYTFLTHSDKGYPAQFPHLFKKLNWWEKRTEEEMPKYLKIDNDKLGLERNHFDYYKVHKWHMDILFAQVDKNAMSGCSPTSFSPEYTYQPCSEEEYLANQ